MRRFRWVRGAVMLGLAGALVGVVPDGVAAVAARSRCRATAFLANGLSNTVSTIDVKARTKNPTDIAVGASPWGVAVTPDGKTAFVTNSGSGSVSTIDVKTRTKHRTDIAVGAHPDGVAVTPDGKTAFVANGSPLLDPIAPGNNTVSTIDVKSRTKKPTDITVGTLAFWVAITPDGKTAVVANNGGSVSTIDMKTRTKHPNDITLGALTLGVAVTPCRR
jgi:YVTN family beta-propeller protein